MAKRLDEMMVDFMSKETLKNSCKILTINKYTYHLEQVLFHTIYNIIFVTETKNFICYNGVS